MSAPNLGYFTGKTVAILGYGREAQDQARRLREHRVRVVIGLREVDDAVPRARADGFPVFTLWDAVAEADIIQVW